MCQRAPAGKLPLLWFSFLYGNHLPHPLIWEIWGHDSQMLSLPEQACKFAHASRILINHMCAHITNMYLHCISRLLGMCMLMYIHIQVYTYMQPRKKASIHTYQMCTLKISLHTWPTYIQVTAVQHMLISRYLYLKQTYIHVCNTKLTHSLSPPLRVSWKWC